MVKIYTISDKRPDFIKHQYEGFANYLQDFNYEFIVCNNGSKIELKNQIDSICNDLKIKTLYVKGEDADGAISTQVPLQYCFKNYIINDSKTDITVIIDSDIFLFKNQSFKDLLGENDIAGIYQQREVPYLFNFFKRNHFYIWNAIMIFKNATVKFKDFDISLIKGVTDVGGMTYEYIKKYLPKINWLNHTPDIENNEKNIFNEKLETQYNENFGMQIIEDSFIHYYRGSNWDASPIDFHKSKTNFLLKFLEFSKSDSPLIKENLVNISNRLSHTKKHFNGIRNNINMEFNINKNYRFNGFR